MEHFANHGRSECRALKWSDADWLDGKLLVERGIIAQQVDDAKTAEPRGKFSCCREVGTSVLVVR
ncbi:MAG: hypothetical protein WCB11_16345 [Terriglobales bacterium]